MQFPLDDILSKNFSCFSYVFHVFHFTLVQLFIFILYFFSLRFVVWGNFNYSFLFVVDANLCLQIT
jgi:hypothetical protein